MRQEKNTGTAQLPGTSGFFANVLGQRSAGTSKRELVILLKPTIINNDGDWVQDIKEVQGRMRAYSTDRPAQ
jgi:MSHA biogenesis protein MshL